MLKRLIVPVACFSFVAQVVSAQSISADLAAETGTWVQHTLYASPDRLTHNKSASGAHGSMNIAFDQGRGNRWLIEEQRYGYPAIAAGLGYDRQDLVNAGIHIFDWGFGKERQDGSFDCPDAFHSASLFVEAAAHAALLIEASPMRARNQAWVDSIKPKLRAAVNWMMRPDVAQVGQRHDSPYTHRYYLDGAAIGEVGALVGDQRMLAASRDYILRGIAQQQPSGINPEKGGSDTSYQALGLQYAGIYYMNVASNDLRAQMRPMIDHGMDWLARRTDASGRVDQTGNTRSGPAGERGPQGNLKEMNYSAGLRASSIWYSVTRNPKWQILAQRFSHAPHGKAS